jgi:hypothetical protein
MSELEAISVKDEIARLNANLARGSPSSLSRPPLAPPPLAPSPLAPPPKLQESIPEPKAKPYAESDIYESGAQEQRSRSNSTCSRAKKTDIYTIASEDEVLRIITEIDSGRLVSNTPCAPWTRGSKHHPCNAETFRVRRHLFLVGPQTRDQLLAALPGIGEKLIRSILHELKEQGIIHTTS